MRVMALAILLMLTPAIGLGQGSRVLTREERAADAQAEAAAWGSLDEDARRILVERSKYIYRYGDDLIIDAYDLLHWQDEARSRVYRTTKEGYVEYRYRVDEKAIVYQGHLPLARFWYRGKLINDPDNRLAIRPAEFRPEQTGAHGGEDHPDQDAERSEPDEVTAAQIDDHLYQTLPVIYVADPATQRAEEADVGTWRRFSSTTQTETGTELRIGAGLLGSILSPLQSPPRDRATPTGSDPRTRIFGVASSPANERQLEGMQRGFLTPTTSAPRASKGAKVGEPPLDVVTYYDIAELDRYRMTPRQVARAFVGGQLEISHREVQRVEGKFKLIETALVRPEFQQE